MTNGEAFVWPAKGFSAILKSGRGNERCTMKFTCPHCQQPLEADDTLHGSAAECPTCGNAFVIQAESLDEPLQPAELPEVMSGSPVAEAGFTPESDLPPKAETLPPPPPPPSAPPKAAPHFRVVSPSASGAEPPSPASPAASKPAPKFRVVSRSSSVKKPNSVAEKPRRKKKLLVGIVLLVVVSIFVCARYFDGEKPPATSSDAFKAKSKPVAADLSGMSVSRLDAFKTEAVSAATEAFDRGGLRYEARWNDDTFSITLWGEMTLGDLERLVHVGDLNAWHHTQKTFQSLCNAFCDSAFSKNLNVHISLKFLDANGESVFGMHDKNITLDILAHLESAPKPGTTKTITLPGGATMEMVWCPPGKFMMDNKCQVNLTKGFWMAKTEVTQLQWQSVMGTTLRQQRSKAGYERPIVGEGDDYPMYYVNCPEAKAFCQKTGLQLPTQAQWEYACRAGSTGEYGGTGRWADMGWCAANSGGRTHPVGQKLPNSWGLHDMHGNVWEWCADYIEILPREPVTNPMGSTDGDYLGRCGGSWVSKPVQCRAGFNDGFIFGSRESFMGFRPIKIP